MFTILAVILWLLFFCAVLVAFYFVFEGSVGAVLATAAIAIVLFFGGYWMQTHRSVPVNYVGVAKDNITQELSPVQKSGLVSKPFFGSVETFPASNSTELCRTYYPSLKGSYGIDVDVCFYIDTANVDWKREIEETGSLDSTVIMSVWLNGVVSDVAKTVKGYTPELLSENREQAQQNLFENVSPWFAERGITLVRVSFIEWDFSSEEVAKTFDESILSQRKITEQTALFEAARISRDRELFEAETDLIVAEKQRQMCSALDLTGEDCNMYLLINLYEEQGQIPDMVITSAGSTGVAVQP